MRQFRGAVILLAVVFWTPAVTSAQVSTPSRQVGTEAADLSRMDAGGDVVSSGEIEGEYFEGPYLGPSTAFRASPFADSPHPGQPGFPSGGFPHFEFDNRHYGHWYRPTAFGLGPYERCQPAPWRPRGYGNLGNRPCTAYRMDYAPFILDDSTSRFGPGYYRRQADERCTCGCCGYCCERLARGPSCPSWMPKSITRLFQRSSCENCR